MSALIAACQAAEERVLRHCRACSVDDACDCGEGILTWVRELEPVDRLSLW